MNAIRLAVNKSGLARLWRNNVGCLQGVRYGLAVGSADLVGITRDGRFVSIEVKTPDGKMRPEQVTWAETVRRFNGIAIVARSVEEAITCLTDTIARASDISPIVQTQRSPSTGSENCAPASAETSSGYFTWLLSGSGPDGANTASSTCKTTQGTGRRKRTSKPST